MQPEPEPEPAPPASGADSAIHYSDGTSAAQSAPSLAAFEALVARLEATGTGQVQLCLNQPSPSHQAAVNQADIN